MRIAIFFDLPSGGASRTMEEIIRILGKHHDVSIYHDPKSFPQMPITPRLFFDLESILFQRWKQKKLAKQIDAQKYDVVFVSHDRHSQSPMILRFLHTPSVFLCQEPTRAYYEEFLRIDPKLPLPNKIYEKLNRYFRKRIEITNANYASKIVANSRYSVESIFRAFGINATPIHLGIDPKEYFQEKTHKKNQVVVVGNNEPQKDLILAVCSVAHVAKKYRPTLIIASPRDSDMTKIIKTAKKLQVKLKIMVGLDQDSLRKIYNQSKLTLALAHLEPFGLSVIESLACGTPVVAVNEGGFKETVIDGKTGVLADRDSQQIAKIIESLILDKKYLFEMGKRGIRDVNKRFTWAITVEKLEKVFHETKTKNRRHHS
ncbi:MAG TPA: glycosyltransferase family 4 protein [Candidatus Woesebacteria bacterium]|nr:glycosyltransferase family 4 protein [Candidatus Woesebacteria bacterium]